MFTNSAHGPRVGLNGFLAFSLKFEQTEITLIKVIKSVAFSFVHAILLFKSVRDWETMGEYTDFGFFSAA